jgi:hypothetical protein
VRRFRERFVDGDRAEERGRCGILHQQDDGENSC